MIETILAVIYGIIITDVCVTIWKNHIERKRRKEIADIEREAANRYCKRWFDMIIEADEKRFNRMAGK